MIFWGIEPSKETIKRIRILESYIIKALLERGCNVYVMNKANKIEGTPLLINEVYYLTYFCDDQRRVEVTVRDRRESREVLYEGIIEL